MISALVLVAMLLGSDVRSREEISFTGRNLTLIFDHEAHSILGVVRGESSGNESEQANNGSDYHQSGLLERQRGGGFGGIRSTSLLDEVIALEAMLLFCFLATCSLIRGYPVGKPANALWIAVGATWTVSAGLCLNPLITGDIWLPWL